MRPIVKRKSRQDFCWEEDDGHANMSSSDRAEDRGNGSEQTLLTPKANAMCGTSHLQDMKLPSPDTLRDTRLGTHGGAIVKKESDLRTLTATGCRADRFRMERLHTVIKPDDTSQNGNRITYALLINRWDSSCQICGQQTH